MSMELYVFLNKCDMPTPEAWQQLITLAGFPLRMDQDFDPLTFSGFLPAFIDEHQTGFEYYFSPKHDVATPDTYLAPFTQSFDSVITFVWGGNLREMCAVMMAAGALASSITSLVHQVDDDSTLAGVEALPYAKQQIAEAEKYLKA